MQLNRLLSITLISFLLAPYTTGLVAEVTGNISQSTANITDVSIVDAEPSQISTSSTHKLVISGQTTRTHPFTVSFTNIIDVRGINQTTSAPSPYEQKQRTFSVRAPVPDEPTNIELQGSQNNAVLTTYPLKERLCGGSCTYCENLSLNCSEQQGDDTRGQSGQDGSDSQSSSSGSSTESPAATANEDDSGSTSLIYYAPAVLFILFVTVAYLSRDETS